MRLLVIVGTQLRHQYFLSQLHKHFELVGVILYERSLVQPPKISLEHFEQSDLDFEKTHLNFLKEQEKTVFAEAVSKNSLNDSNVLEVSSRKQLNSADAIEWVRACKADAMIDYGSGILSNDLLDALPEWKINLHGGLSPYFRGSATLLWPFYMQQPELAGITYHLLSSKVDGGEILQHARPSLRAGDKVYEIGTRAILEGTEVGVKLLQKLASNGSLEKTKQWSAGKLFIERDYKPSHLKVVYQLFKDGLIERYLESKNTLDAQYRFINQLGEYGATGLSQ
jgi:folate-dependent phosphoribosylglycinamide formyltransferase PurN